jgi:TRAP-type transport system periplasmic protein
VQINTVDKAPFAKATSSVDDKWLATSIGPFLKKVIAAAR